MKKLWSVFTDDMDHCIETGSPYVHRHHIFTGMNGNRAKSEKYGFVIPIHYKLHEDHPGAVHRGGPTGKERDVKYKQMAQTYYEEHIGTREEFRAEFGKSWL